MKGFRKWWVYFVMSAAMVMWNETISDFTSDWVTGKIPLGGNTGFPSEASDNKDVIFFHLSSETCILGMGPVGIRGPQVKTPSFCCFWLVFPSLCCQGFTGNQPVSW